jgi:fructose-1,6-bisphosphatase I
MVALEQVALAVKRISNELAGAALKGELGYSGAINVHGEEVEKLDTWSDNVFVDTFSGGGPVCTLISEEMEEPRHFKGQCARYSYALLYDPLDGSSTSTARSGRSSRSARASPTTATVSRTCSRPAAHR